MKSTVTIATYFRVRVFHNRFMKDCQHSGKIYAVTKRNVPGYLHHDGVVRSTAITDLGIPSGYFNTEAEVETAFELWISKGRPTE
jgi:hypothetical protein